MSRLTNRGTNGEIWITDNDETRQYGRKETAFKKLADYEDKQEQGLLIELPCKVGDTVYFISREDIIPVEIDSISINENALLLNGTNKEHYGYSRITLSTKENIYFTRSEAEEALAKMGGK